MDDPDHGEDDQLLVAVDQSVGATESAYGDPPADEPAEPADDAVGALVATIREEMIAQGGMVHEAKTAAEYEGMTDDGRQKWQAGIRERQQEMELELLAEARRRLRSSEAPLAASISAPVAVGPQSRASAREHRGQRVASGGRSPDDPDPEAAREQYLARKRRNIADLRERKRKLTCSRCGCRVERLHDGLCLKHWQAKKREEKLEALRVRGVEAPADVFVVSPVGNYSHRVNGSGAHYTGRVYRTAGEPRKPIAALVSNERFVYVPGGQS